MENTEVFLEDKFLRQALRNARVSRHLTQQQIAEKAGLSAATISSIETGDGSPTLRSLIRYANALGYGFKLRKCDTNEPTAE